MQNTLRLFFIIIALLVSTSGYSQSDSEIIKTFSYYQVKNKTLALSNNTVLQINNRMGDDEAKISIFYTKGDKLSINEARIEDLDGNIIRKLKGKEIEDISHISGGSLYQDHFLKTFDLKHNLYPYRVVYSYTMVFNKFMRIATFDSEGSKIPINMGVLYVDVPTDYQIAYLQENMDQPSIDTSSGSTKYCWNYEYAVSGGLGERSRSVNQITAPFLDIIPINFKYGIEGSQDSWGSFGDWIYRLNKGKDELPFAEQRKIEGMLEGVNSDRQKAKILYRYLQDNNRYINVSIDVGGFQTYPASYVVANRYGDCKALTNYMKSMLKFAGIESYYTLIKAGEKVRDINHNHVSQVFNHAILTVPLENDTIFLECTSKDSPFGYLGTFTQGREALVIDSTGSRFISIPSLTPEDVLCSRTFNVDMSTSEVSIKSIERGAEYEQSLYFANNVNQNTIDRYIKENIFSGSFDLEDFKLVKSEDEAQILLSVTCRTHSSLFKKYGNNLVLSPFPITIAAYESPENRITDVQLDYPEYYQDTIVYRLSSDNQKIENAPQSISIKSEYGSYDVDYKIDGDNLIQYKTIFIAAGRYGADEYEAFYRFVSLVKSNELKNIYLELL